VRYHVLGPLRVVDENGDVTPTGHRQRRLLSALLLERGAVVSADRLVEVLWPDRLPADHAAALQTHVFRLRRALPPSTIETVAAGYRLTTPPDDVDAERFARLVTDVVGRGPGDAVAAFDRLGLALSWWRGDPYEDVADTDGGRIEADRLRELHVLALEERHALLLELHRGPEAVPGLVSLVGAHPLRERPRALLMAALHATGRSAEASRVHDDFSRVLAEELGLEPSAGLIRLHGEIVAGTASPVVLARGGPPILSASRIPAAVNTLIGRDALVGEVVSELTSELDDHRLVTLIGTGGVGKTRIATEVARRLSDAGRTVWFCELASVDAAGVDVVVAETVGVEARAGTALLQRITDVLRAESGLLVLDNCEHVIDEAALVVDAVLQRCPDLRLLATTRERLAVPGERLRPVAPFPVHDAAGPDDPALRLFAERAQAVQPGFALDALSLPAVTQICRRLDGLPLAIELAAARLQTLRLDEVVSGLEHRFRLLTSGDRTSPRQRSLAAAMAWSHDLLDPPTQRAFDSLGVFAGPFPIAGAAEVLELDSPDATEVLVALAERSLVHRVGDGRFALLETLKHFALDQLAATNRLDELRTRHARWALHVARSTAARLGVVPTAAPMLDVDATLGELRAAHRRFVETADAASDLELVVALNDYGFFGMRPEVLAWAEDAVQLGLAVQHPSTPEAMAVAGLGAWKRGDLDGTARFARQAIELAERLGVPDSWITMDLLGVHGLVSGNIDEALTCFDRALRSDAAGPGDPRRLVTRANRVLALAVGNHPLAATDAQELIAGLSTAPTPHGAFAWYVAAEAVAATDPREALRRAQRSIADAEATGARFVTGVAGALVASLDVRAGEVTRAVTAYRWLIPWWWRAGEWSVLWTMLRSVVELFCALGRYRAAALLLGAVTAPGSGHEVFGDDAERLALLSAELAARMGDAAFAEARAEGRALDVESAAALTATELDMAG
jgi:predicted ATPase/DNA-binding SARP family transcriptional activator